MVSYCTISEIFKLPKRAGSHLKYIMFSAKSRLRCRTVKILNIRKWLLHIYKQVISNAMKQYCMIRV
jgi:hypothetical protein